jgi:proline iminopeptidase
MMAESFIVSQGINIWTIRSGQGYPILLCNGGPGCCDYLEPVAGMLDDVAQVIRFEQPGCGRSQPAPTYNIETCLTDIENIRNYYQIERLIIGGHSWGADLALFYALKYSSHVAGLICLAGGRIHNDREWHSEYKRRKETEGEQIPRFDYPLNLDVNKQLNLSWKHYIQTPTLLRAISRLELPALFVYGERDIRPSWPVEQVANLIPDARFEVIEGAEHVIWFSRPNELKLLLRNFVNDIKGGKMESSCDSRI